MKVVMPVATIHHEARAALLAATSRPLFMDVSASAHDYGRLVNWLWAEHTGFILVEHDIVVRPDTIAELQACPELWCGFPYLEARGEPVTGLGCTKFSRKLVRSVPPPIEPNTIWQNVDANVGPRLRALGFEIHRHMPPVRHLNPRVAQEDQPW